MHTILCQCLEPPTGSGIQPGIQVTHRPSNAAAGNCSHAKSYTSHILTRAAKPSSKTQHDMRGRMHAVLHGFGRLIGSARVRSILLLVIRVLVCMRIRGIFECFKQAQRYPTSNLILTVLFFAVRLCLQLRGCQVRGRCAPFGALHE